MHQSGSGKELRLQRAGANFSANDAGADVSTNTGDNVSADNEPANASADNEPLAQFGSLLATIAATIGKSERRTLRSAACRCSQLHTVEAADDCAF